MLECDISCVLPLSPPRDSRAYVNHWAMCSGDLYNSCFIIFSFFLYFLRGVTPVEYGSSQLGIKLELQLPAYATAAATPDLSRVCDLHCSSWQCQILNPLSEVRDRTHVLMDTGCVCNPLSHKGNAIFSSFLISLFFLSFSCFLGLTSK